MQISSTNAVSISTAKRARVGVEFVGRWRPSVLLQRPVSAVALSDYVVVASCLKRKGRKTCYTFFFFLFEDFGIYANVSSGASSPVITRRYWLNTMRNKAAILCCVTDGVLFCVGQ